MMRWKKQGRTRHAKEDTDTNRRDIDRPVFRALPFRRNGRIFGIASNTFLYDQAGTAGSYPWAAKLVRFGNRLETTTGANSRS